MTERAFRIRAVWDRADGVAAPELAATWCELTIDVADDLVTLVQDRRSESIRPSVRTSAYPLAQWIAQNWWTLTEHVRASATNTGTLRWGAPRLRPSWLANHNLRGAGDGMPWPDLAVLPEGAIARLVWFKGDGLAHQPISFLTSGSAFVPMSELRTALTEFVEFVLDRLAGAGITDTQLHEEWRALADLTNEERDFALACGRLGLDPFAVSDSQADDIEHLDDRVPHELLDDFLAAADAENLDAAAQWVDAARARLRPAKPMEFEVITAAIDVERPWTTGYATAREVRAQLGLAPTDPMPLDDYVGIDEIDRPFEGLRGLAGRVDDGIGLVVPKQRLGRGATRFSQAWALGLTTIGGRNLAILDPSHRTVPRASRAFAAELLAPAAGVEQLLTETYETDEDAFEFIAEHFGASSRVIEYQVQNQILAQPS